jgi:hypothetical protein
MNVINPKAESAIIAATKEGASMDQVASAMLACLNVAHWSRFYLSSLIRAAYAQGSDGLQFVAGIMSEALRSGGTTEYAISQTIKLASVLCSTEPALQSVGLRWKLNSDATVTVVARAERAKRDSKSDASAKGAKPTAEAAKPAAKGLDWQSFGRAVLAAAGLTEPREQSDLTAHADLIAVALQSFTAAAVAKPERKRASK